MNEKPDYWFPARRYGLGWRMFATWQGCVLFGATLALIAVGVAIFPPGEKAGFAICEAAVGAVAFAICLVKGAPLKWHWGGGEDD